MLSLVPPDQDVPLEVIESITSCKQAACFLFLVAGRCAWKSGIVAEQIVEVRVSPSKKEPPKRDSLAVSLATTLDYYKD